MGNSEEPKATKSDKPSSPADQTNVHVYPDWAAMQAYYGPRVAMPPYYNSAMSASGHPPPPYMWSPQTSALDSSNVTAAFETVVKEIYNILSRKVMSSLSNGKKVLIPSEAQGESKKSGCCST